METGDTNQVVEETVAFVKNAIGNKMQTTRRSAPLFPQVGRMPRQRSTVGDTGMDSGRILAVNAAAFVRRAGDTTDGSFVCVALAAHISSNVFVVFTTR